MFWRGIAGFSQVCPPELPSNSGKDMAMEQEVYWYLVCSIIAQKVAISKTLIQQNNSVCHVHWHLCLGNLCLGNDLNASL